MDFTPRPDCGACGGSGTIKIIPEAPSSISNQGPCVTCYFAPAEANRAASEAYINLASLAFSLAVVVAQIPNAGLLSASVCRRAEWVLRVGRDLANGSNEARLNDAVLALDSIAADIEYAHDHKADVQKARAAVTAAGRAIDEVRRLGAT